MTELGGVGSTATLTLAFRLVLEAQQRHEPTAWVGHCESSFYPVDAADSGVDLDALVVVRLPDPAGIPRAAAELARSGAFGLLLLDLRTRAVVPMPLQSRLLGWAQKHDMAVVFLCEKPLETPSLGSLISLRGHTQQQRQGDGEFLCSVTAVKDKRRAPGWSYQEVCRGPVGLR